MPYMSEASEELVSGSPASSGQAPKRGRSPAGPPMSPGNTRRIQFMLAMSILAPWLITCMILTLFLCLYHRHAPWVWSFVCMCFAMSCVAYVVPHVRRKRPLAVLGLLLVVASTLGTAVGFLVHHMHMQRYWEIWDAPALANLDPLTDGAKAALQTAGQLSFVKDTFVDDRRTLGYVHGAQIYCVAPIVRPPRYTDDVSFWASGLGCCEMRSNFVCSSGDLSASGAYTAVLINDASEHLRSAVKEATSMYHLKEKADNATHILMSLSESNEIRDGLKALAYQDCFALCWVTFVVYAATSMIVIRKMLVATYSAMPLASRPG